MGGVVCAGIDFFGGGGGCAGGILCTFDGGSGCVPICVPSYNGCTPPPLVCITPLPSVCAPICTPVCTPSPNVCTPSICMPQGCNPSTCLPSGGLPSGCLPSTCLPVRCSPSICVPSSSVCVSSAPCMKGSCSPSIPCTPSICAPSASSTPCIPRTSNICTPSICMPQGCNPSTCLPSGGLPSGCNPSTCLPASCGMGGKISCAMGGLGGGTCLPCGCMGCGSVGSGSYCGTPTSGLPSANCGAVCAGLYCSASTSCLPSGCNPSTCLPACCSTGGGCGSKCICSGGCKTHNLCGQDPYACCIPSDCRSCCSACDCGSCCSCCSCMGRNPKHRTANRGAKSAKTMNPSAGCSNYNQGCGYLSALNKSATPTSPTGTQCSLASGASLLSNTGKGCIGALKQLTQINPKGMCGAGYCLNAIQCKMGEYGQACVASGLGYACGGSADCCPPKCDKKSWDKAFCMKCSTADLSCEKPHMLFSSPQDIKNSLHPLNQIKCGIHGSKSGGLPHKYAKAAPKGHNPEFITGMTGYYACGRGTGQSDDIPAMLHDGDYVMDAETVSALGDGSSKAGHNVLEGFRKQVPHKAEGGSNPVPAKIADGEYVFPAAFVTALGSGDNKRGAEILDGLREKLRAHKRSAPDTKIPPKAKDPIDYIKKGRK